jgi:hypothetical protein
MIWECHDDELGTDARFVMHEPPLGEIPMKKETEGLALWMMFLFLLTLVACKILSSSLSGAESEYEKLCFLPCPVEQPVSPYERIHEFHFTKELEYESIKEDDYVVRSKPSRRSVQYLLKVFDRRLIGARLVEVQNAFGLREPETRDGEKRIPHKVADNYHVELFFKDDLLVEIVHWQKVEGDWLLKRISASTSLISGGIY